MREYPSLDKELALEASGLGSHGLKPVPSSKSFMTKDLFWNFNFSSLQYGLVFVFF
jgi:hypothetical protein